MLVRAAASLLLALGCAAATPLPPSPACAVVAGWPRATVVAVDLLWSYLGQSPLPPAAARAQAAAAMRAACSARGFSVLRLAGHTAPVPGCGVLMRDFMNAPLIEKAA